MYLCKADAATFACRPHSSPPVAARRPACRQTGRQTWCNATAPPTRPPPPLAAVSPSSRPAPCDKAPAPGCACSCVSSCACVGTRVCSTAPSRVRRRRSHAAPRALRAPRAWLTSPHGPPPLSPLPPPRGAGERTRACRALSVASLCPWSVLVRPALTLASWSSLSRHRPSVHLMHSADNTHSANLRSARGGGKCTVTCKKPHSGRTAPRALYLYSRNKPH